LGMSEEKLAAKDAEIDALIERAVENALAAPYPDPEQDSGTEFKE
jgi:TPP-dependent pyruvate/acetoin dehydrogenase alpha subunit